jgi:hypothetical protein
MRDIRVSTADPLDHLRAAQPLWLVPWAAYMLGLLVGAALAGEAVEVALGVVGLPLAWGVGWLAQEWREWGWLAFAFVFVVGLGVGLLAT